MKRIVELSTVAIFLILFSFVALADTEKYSYPYNGKDIASIDNHTFVFTDSIVVNPNESIVIYGETTIENAKVRFDFAKLEVLRDYKVQAHVKTYIGTDIRGKWEKFGGEIKNNETHFSDSYTYGPIISDSEQEGFGIDFHDYAASDEGVKEYAKVKAQFESVYKKAKGIEPLQPLPAASIGESLALVNKRLVDQASAWGLFSTTAATANVAAQAAAATPGSTTTPGATTPTSTPTTTPSTPTPSSTLPASAAKFNLANIEKLILKEINDGRAKLGWPEVSADPAALAQARATSIKEGHFYRLDTEEICAKKAPELKIKITSDAAVVECFMAEALETKYPNLDNALTMQNAKSVTLGVQFCEDNGVAAICIYILVKEAAPVAPTLATNSATAISTNSPTSGALAADGTSTNPIPTTATPPTAGSAISETAIKTGIYSEIAKFRAAQNLKPMKINTKVEKWALVIADNTKIASTDTAFVSWTSWGSVIPGKTNG